MKSKARLIASGILALISMIVAYELVYGDWFDRILSHLNNHFR